VYPTVSKAPWLSDNCRSGLMSGSSAGRANLRHHKMLSTRAVACIDAATWAAAYFHMSNVKRPDVSRNKVGAQAKAAEAASPCGGMVNIGEAENEQAPEGSHIHIQLGPRRRLEGVDGLL
jgi:hypothetical protein